MTDPKLARLARVIVGLEMMDGTPGPRAHNWPPPEPEPKAHRYQALRPIARTAQAIIVYALALWGAFDIARRMI